MTSIRIDFGNLMSPQTEGGVSPDLLRGDMAERFTAAMVDVAAQREAGVLGFLDLPYAADHVAQVKELADGFGQWFEDVVVLGIGGSGLGATSLRDALLGPFWNSRSDEARDHYPRLHVVDNPDPYTLQALLNRVDPARTLFNVISKSGATAETMAQYLVVRDRLDKEVGSDKARGHFLFTTDPENGALRQIGDAEGIPMLPVPSNVGGRFSVLSAVGLLPAAVSGVDIDALLEGAAQMEERCRSTDLASNPAGILASLLHHADTEQGRSVHVLMPYADRLRAVALWFQQLWAESLGKTQRLDGTNRPTGPTPLPALGATDQHSVLQLLMEGPHDKVVLFVDVDDAEADVTIPDRHPEIPALDYLGGHSLAELLTTERRATAEALRRGGRPNATIVLPKIDAFALGQLYMLFEVATVIAGTLYGVNPMDQPGVELSKLLTYGLMGREGVVVPEIAEPDPDWVV
ncbi:MAG: glucose-6-phosphate isomerase [Gemmatimonadales bacterium]|jgi:glucose-6-phosphate isomerase|nr:glucose-6-phosphate isomerase [Gemmatimonadales bacterium]MDG2241779.1 glucose-6-phosphate isomerase [Longimicrobiales bacterium]MBT3500636.1 glucose-6-phosphate isomerase [Gemmatimonadales bacterium]MBT3773174.1 glucose-6-phosphate isomerase [Gemmatimonadales bacterium]MBT3957553.1 glucose-6-phosphate isomerase [Gemmatimonadales bacterium]